MVRWTSLTERKRASFGERPSFALTSCHPERSCSCRCPERRERKVSAREVSSSRIPPEAPPILSREKLVNRTHLDMVVVLGLKGRQHLSRDHVVISDLEERRRVGLLGDLEGIRILLQIQTCSRLTLSIKRESKRLTNPSSGTSPKVGSYARHV